MDNLTHALAGAALAETRLRRATAFAGPALVLGANLPDVDALCYLGGSDFGMEARRGITHGPLGIALLPLVLATALLLVDRRLRARDPARPPCRGWVLLGLAYLGALTHPALDLLNTYGIRLLAPFSPRWFYGDALYIMDPWLWLLLGGGVYLARGARGVASPWRWGLLAAATSLALLAGPRSVPVVAKVVWVVLLAGLLLWRGFGFGPRTAPGAQRLALATVVVASAYILALVGLGRSGQAVARAALARSGAPAPDALLVSPRPANPLRWDVVVASAGRYHFGEIRWLGTPRFALAEATVSRPLAGTDPVIGAALAAPAVRGLAGWLRFPLVAAEPLPGGGFLVRIGDARFARTARASALGAAVRLDRDLHPVD